MKNTSMREEVKPVRVPNSSMKSLLNVSKPSSLITPGKWVAMEAKINKTQIVKLSSEVVRRRGGKGIASFFFRLRNDGIEVSNE